MRTSRALALPVALTLLPGCSPATAPSHLATEVPDASRGAAPAPERLVAARRGEAVLRDPTGVDVGVARFVEDAHGQVHVTVHVQDVAPGLHGLHLHGVGACDGTTTPAFSSAGGHFNPTGRQHGHLNPQGHHSGDLPNLTADEGGVGHLAVTLGSFSLAELLDDDGTALVLHQNEDDLRTDAGPLGPGNSGPRIACGVLSQP